MGRLTRSSPLALERGITLHQLRVFKAVADNLSFSQAAQGLRLSQPSVSGANVRSPTLIARSSLSNSVPGIKPSSPSAALAR